MQLILVIHVHLALEGPPFDRAWVRRPKSYSQHANYQASLPYQLSHQRVQGALYKVSSILDAIDTGAPLSESIFLTLDHKRPIIIDHADPSLPLLCNHGSAMRRGTVPR